MPTYVSTSRCKRGHLGLRRTNNGNCVDCHRGDRARNLERYRKVRKIWARSNIDKIAEYRGHEPPTRPMPDRCELCNRKPRNRLHMDHDHKTLKFRGWLCSGCNTKLGGFFGTIEGLTKVMAYLRAS